MNELCEGVVTRPDCRARSDRPRASCFPHVHRTLAISCEAVPASEMGRRGHPTAPPTGHGAGGSFVSFIALFDGPR